MTGKKKQQKPTQSLIDALIWVKQLYNKKTNPYCSIYDNKLIMCQNTHMAVPVDVQVNCNPHVDELLKTLKQISGEFSFTTCGDNCLIVKADNFEAVVPCDENCIIDSYIPPHPQAIITNSIKDACKLLYPCVDELNPEPAKSRVLLQCNNAIGSDGCKVIEYYHGCSIPTVLIPKKAAEIVGKCKQNLTGFGFNDHYCTFHFEDGRTVTCDYVLADYPDINLFFKMTNIVPIPDNFFKSIKTLKPFIDKNERLYFKQNKITSSKEENATTVSIENIPENCIFNYNFLLNFDKFTSWNLRPGENIIEFFSDIARGILIGIEDDEQPEN